MCNSAENAAKMAKFHQKWKPGVQLIQYFPLWKRQKEPLSVIAKKPGEHSCWELSIRASFSDSVSSTLQPSLSGVHYEKRRKTLRLLTLKVRQGPTKISPKLITGTAVLVQWNVVKMHVHCSAEVASLTLWEIPAKLVATFTVLPGRPVAFHLEQAAFAGPGCTKTRLWHVFFPKRNGCCGADAFLTTLEV